MEAGEGAKMTRFIAGDPLRGVGSLAVFTWHVAFLTLQAANLHTLIGADLDIAVVYGPLLGDPARAAGLAIDLFFLLSGYLIARPFVQAYVHGRRRPRLGRYARNRILRIYPPYLAVCACVIAIYGLEGLGVANTIGVLLLTDVAGYGWSQKVAPVWSVNVEVAFYAAMPMVMLAIAWATRPLRGPVNRALLVCGIAVAVGTVSLATHWHGYTVATLIGMWWAFVPGVMLAAAEPFALRALRGNDRVARIARWLSLAGFLMVLAGFMAVTRTAGGGAAKLYALIGMALLLGGMLVNEWAGRRPPRVLDNRFCHWLGARSYSLFLVHWWVGLEVSELVAGWELGPKKAFAVTWVLTLAGALAATEVLHRLVERPAMQLAGRRRPRAAAAEATPA